ncbi:MAG TPA: hypothetical protein VMV69_08820 [Pirellulales bacterium]|nr:hypothetical protein [Pirellulales bacterium]
MDVLTAYEKLANRKDRSAFPCDVEITAPDGSRVDAWAEGAAAAAWLSGQLDDATTDAELDEALAYYVQLKEMGGVIDEERWHETIKELLAELMAWGNANVEQEECVPC